MSEQPDNEPHLPTADELQARVDELDAENEELRLRLAEALGAHPA